MKGSFIFSILISCQILSGQILCIKCYDQNDSISSGVHNLLQNGGFEEINCIPDTFYDSFCPNSISYGCDIINWKCTGGGTETYAKIYHNDFSIIPEGKNATYFGNWYAYSCSNISFDTSCLKGTSCVVTNIPAGYPQSELGYGDQLGVSLEQSVSGLNPGDIYVLEFWAGGESSWINKGLFAVDIGFGNTFLRCKPTKNFSIDRGTIYLIQFMAVSNSHTIKFTNWGHICGNCTELVLDNVRLYTLAELSPSVTPCFTATDNLNEDDLIELYPNPFTNELLVKSNNFEEKEVILYDITSRILLQKSFINSVSLNTKKLAKGIYFYEVRNKNGSIKNGKILKV